MTKLEFSNFQLSILRDMIDQIEEVAYSCAFLLHTVDEHTVEVCDPYCSGSCSCNSPVGMPPCGHCENSHGYNRSGEKPGKDDYRWER